MIYVICLAQLTMSYMEKRCRNKILLLYFIIFMSKQLVVFCTILPTMMLFGLVTV